MTGPTDKIHTAGMSDDDSTYMTVGAVAGLDNEETRVVPPINVILEGENARVAVRQGDLAARYTDAELRDIGEGNSMVGLTNVIGSIATQGLERGATKPLHPTLIDVDVVDVPELSVPRHELTD